MIFEAVGVVLSSIAITAVRLKLGDAEAAAAEVEAVATSRSGLKRRMDACSGDVKPLAASTHPSTRRALNPVVERDILT